MPEELREYLHTHRWQWFRSSCFENTKFGKYEYQSWTKSTSRSVLTASLCGVPKGNVRLRKRPPRVGTTMKQKYRENIGNCRKAGETPAPQKRVVRRVKHNRQVRQTERQGTHFCPKKLGVQECVKKNKDGNHKKHTFMRLKENRASTPQTSCWMWWFYPTLCLT